MQATLDDWTKQETFKPAAATNTINEGQGPVKQHPLDDQDDHNKSNCVISDSPSYFIISSLELGVV